MEELDNNQILAIEEFAKGLQECFVNKKNAPADNKLMSIAMDYVLKVIDIHLELARLKLARYAYKMEEAMNK